MGKIYKLNPAIFSYGLTAASAIAMWRISYIPGPTWVHFAVDAVLISGIVIGLFGAPFFMQNNETTKKGKA